MGVREMERFLEQWQMDARDLRRRLILSPTPRERHLGSSHKTRWEVSHAMLLLAQGWTASALSPWGAWNNFRQYLREWLYDGSDRARPCQTELDVSLCFAPPRRPWPLIPRPAPAVPKEMTVIVLCDGSGGTPCCCWPKHRPRRRPWNGIPTPLADGPPPSVRAGRRP